MFKIASIPWVLVMFCGYPPSITAQFRIDAELRPRVEYRHGYRTIFPENEDASALVSQRTRLSTKYTIKDFELFISVQNIRLWGDVSQLNKNDENGVAVFQAWAKFNFNEYLTLKLGRQEIGYDDLRFFGTSNWVQQGRAHDAAMFRYAKNDFSLDVGLAYNQSENSLTGNTLFTPSTYKSMQLARSYRSFNNFSVSLLFANIGFQFLDENNANNNSTYHNQTFGGYFKYYKSKLTLHNTIFGQIGKDLAGNNLQSCLYHFSGSWEENKTTFMLEFQYLSGNEGGTPNEGKNKAFTPFFGNNHKYNGFMDYFYVGGGHINSVGLIDINSEVSFSLSEKTKLNATLHNFSSPRMISTQTSRQLGIELDVVLSYKPLRFVDVLIGYSQLFANDNLKVLRNVESNESNYFLWSMITIKPKLFSNGAE